MKVLRMGAYLARRLWGFVSMRCCEGVFIKVLRMGAYLARRSWRVFSQDGLGESFAYVVAEAFS